MRDEILLGAEGDRVGDGVDVVGSFLLFLGGGGAGDADSAVQECCFVSGGGEGCIKGACGRFGVVVVYWWCGRHC